MKKRTLFLVFILALMIGAVAHIPVNLFIKEGRLGPVSIYGSSGTIWSGRADVVQVARGYQVRQLDWSLNPLYLLIGAAKVHVQFQFLDGRGYGDVSVNVAQTATVSNFEYEVEADQFTQQFLDGFVGLEGKTRVQIDHVEYEIGELFMKNLSGYVSWDKSGVAYPVSGTFGNLSALLSQDETSGLVTAELSNKGGEVALSGSATLNPNRQYQTNIKIKPRPGITPALRDTLSGVMPAQGDGSYQLSRTGQL